MGSISNKERDNRLIIMFTHLHCYGRRLIIKILPYLIRGSLFIGGVISGQVKLLIKQICNLKYDTGTLILKQLISIPKSSMCLVFEEPLQSFYKHNTSGWLESLGQLHPLRLQHVKKLHIIVESENMAYIARHGGGVHYETCYGDVVATLEHFPMPYMLYERNTDYSTDFIYLLSNPATVKEYTNAIAWDFVNKKLSEHSCKDEKRNQKQSEGYGYTSGMCMSTKNTTNSISVAEPQIRKNTSL